MPVSIITASYDHKIVFWELGGVARRTLPFTDSQVNCLALSPDKSKLAVGGHGCIRLFDATQSAAAQNQNAIGIADGSLLSGNVTSMHFIDIGAVKGTSTDDTADKSRRVGNEYTLLVTSEDGSIKVFALRSNASTSSSPASSNQQPSNQITFVLRHEVLTKVPITAASILPNQQILLTGTQLGRISVWHMPAILSLNGALSTTIPTSEGVDESQLNSATSNNVLQQKALVGPKPIQELSLEADPTSIRSIAVSPMSNFIAVASNIGRVHFFAFCRGEDALRERKEGDSAIATIRPIRNSNPHFNQSLNPYALEEFTFIVAHEKYILKIAIPPNCRYIATASADYTVGAFGVPDYLASGQFIAFSDLYNGLASTPNTAQEATFEDSKASADAAALQFPGGVAAGIEDPRLWFPLRRTFLGHQRWVWDCSISPCSSFILTVSSDHSGRLWKVEGDLSSPSPAPLSAERLVTDLANPQTTPPPTVVNTSIAVYNFHNKTVNCCLLDIEP